MEADYGATGNVPNRPYPKDPVEAVCEKLDTLIFAVGVTAVILAMILIATITG